MSTGNVSKFGSENTWLACVATPWQRHCVVREQEVPLCLMLDQTGLDQEHPDISASGSGVKNAILSLLKLHFDFSVQQENIFYEMHLV